MAMLAGYGRFLMEVILPEIKSRERVLSVSRMSMAWIVDDFLTQIKHLNLDYDTAIFEQIKQQNGYFTTDEFFRLLGFSEYEDIDVDSSEGVSVVHDMNTPVPIRLHERYDFICENGTIEHIFDIKTAMGNIAHMVKVGGVVSHGSPMDAFNHGFYNFSINFFNDFYRANGFSDLQFYLVRYAANWRENQSVMVEPIDYTHEEFYIDPSIYTSELNKMYISCSARKIEHVHETRVPTQAAYNPALGLSSRLTRSIE
jgi:hypothetical protein